MVESNGLAYDGRGFTMEVIAGVRGRTDRIGRVRADLRPVPEVLLRQEFPVLGRLLAGIGRLFPESVDAA